MSSFSSLAYMAAILNFKMADIYRGWKSTYFNQVAKHGILYHLIIRIQKMYSLPYVRCFVTEQNMLLIFHLSYLCITYHLICLICKVKISHCFLIKWYMYYMRHITYKCILSLSVYTSMLIFKLIAYNYHLATTVMKPNLVTTTQGEYRLKYLTCLCHVCLFGIVTHTPLHMHKVMLLTQTVLQVSIHTVE